MELIAQQPANSMAAGGENLPVLRRASRTKSLGDSRGLCMMHGAHIGVVH